MTNEEMENVVVLISVVCLKSLHIVLNDIHEWKDREADREEEWPGDKGAGGCVDFKRNTKNSIQTKASTVQICKEK